MLTEKDYCDKDLSASLMEMGFRGFGHFYYEKGNSKLKATHQFLTVRTAKALGHTLAISLYDAQKWLREEKKIEVNASFDKENNKWIAFIQRLDYLDLYDTDIFDTVYNTYEEALLEGINEAIKILKENKTS